MGNCISANPQKPKEKEQEAPVDVSVYVKQAVIKRDGAPMSNKVKKIKSREVNGVPPPAEEPKMPPPDPSESMIKV